MAEPYSPTSEARLFPGSVTAINNNPARLSARDDLLPPSRQESFSSPSRKNSSQTLLPPYSDSASHHDITYPGGPGAVISGHNPQMDKTKETQQQIAQVTEQLHKNIDMINERGERLDRLKDKSDQLSIHSQLFKTQASTVRRKMWWKNLKWTICIGVFVVIIIAGAVGGGIRSHKYLEEHKVVTETQTVPPQTASAVPTLKF